MLYWSAVFFILALISAILGFGGIAAAASAAVVVGKILFFVFLVAFVVSLLMGVFRRSF